MDVDVDKCLNVRPTITSAIQTLRSAVDSVTAFDDFDARQLRLRGRVGIGIRNSAGSPLNVIGDRCRVGPSVEETCTILEAISKSAALFSQCLVRTKRLPVPQVLMANAPTLSHRFSPPPIASHSQTRRADKALHRASTQPASFRPSTALCPPGSDPLTSWARRFESNRPGAPISWGRRPAPRLPLHSLSRGK